jgi:hypothetical protein
MNIKLEENLYVYLYKQILHSYAIQLMCNCVTFFSENLEAQPKFKLLNIYCVTVYSVILKLTHCRKPGKLDSILKKRQFLSNSSKHL